MAFYLTFGWQDDWLWTSADVWRTKKYVSSARLWLFFSMLGALAYGLELVSID